MQKNELKDVLLYTDEELELLSNEELENLISISSEKETYYDTEQLTLKLLMNSLYGCLGNKWFPLFNEDFAAAITGNGRYFIQKSANYIEKHLQTLLPQDKEYVIYGDTDSFYFQIEPFMTKHQEKNPGLDINEYVEWADQFEKKIIQPVVQKSINDFCDELNAYNQEVVGVEREVISDKTVFAAKKKYYSRVRDSEGTRFPADDPYIKVMGLEIIKSTTPLWSKKYLKEAIPHILDKNETDLINWINSIKQTFMEVNPMEIATVGGVSRIDYNLTDKGVPFGSRAAIVHNNYVKEHELENSIAPINAGDKCKRLFLQQPNKFNSNVVAFTNDAFIKEIDGIDYDTQFDKGFLSGLNLMVKCLDYNLEKETESIDDW